MINTYSGLNPPTSWLSVNVTNLLFDAEIVQVTKRYINVPM